MNKEVNAAKDRSPIRILFIGNSATYVHELPQRLAAEAGRAGYAVEVNSVTKGGYELLQHADTESEHGKRVYREIESGYDIVFLQDNGNCISSAEKRSDSASACKMLDEAIRRSGAETCIYVRPPYGKEAFGRSAFDQCVEFDKHFCNIAEQTGGRLAFVNRAFALAIKHGVIDLWGPDNAHTSECGGYLAVCVFFATLVGTLPSLFDGDVIPREKAEVLQEIADRVVLKKELPW